jgi:hypothetical protein
MARQQPFNAQMGLGMDRSDDPDLPGRTGYVYGELAARGFYRRWAQVLGARSWAELAPRGLGEVASHG